MSPPERPSRDQRDGPGAVRWSGAAGAGPGSSAPISTEVSSSARIYANGSASSAGKRSRSCSSVSDAAVCQILVSSGPLTQWRRCVGPSCATGRPATVIVNRSPASARRSLRFDLRFGADFFAVLPRSTRDEPPGYEPKEVSSSQGFSAVGRLGIPSLTERHRSAYSPRAATDAQRSDRSDPAVTAPSSMAHRLLSAGVQTPLAGVRGLAPNQVQYLQRTIGNHRLGAVLRRAQGMPSPVEQSAHPDVEARLGRQTRQGAELLLRSGHAPDTAPGQWPLAHQLPASRSTPTPGLCFSGSRRRLLLSRG